MLGLCLADAIRRFAEARNGKPEVITRQWTTRPYLTRWTVADMGRRGRVFLHHFQDHDADAMHSHPWAFQTFILAGGYFETAPTKGWNPENATGPTRTQWYGPGRLLVRPSSWVHRVRLKEVGGEPQACWTLLHIGPRVNATWSFFCPGIGPKVWRKHLADYYKNGDGCAGVD